MVLWDTSDVRLWKIKVENNDHKVERAVTRRTAEHERQQIERRSHLQEVFVLFLLDIAVHR